MTTELEERVDPLSLNDIKVKEDDTEEVEVRVYSCDFCEFKTGTAASCQHHIRKSHNLRPCTFCHFYADTLPNLNFHQETEHGIDPFQSPGEEEELKCEVCQTEFKTLQGLRLHSEVQHKGVRYSCDECEFKTSYKTSLKLHIGAKHRGIEYNCDKCDFKAGYRKLLNRHMKAGRHDVGKETIKSSTGVVTVKRLIRREKRNNLVSYHRFAKLTEGKEDEKKDVENPHSPDESGLIWCQYVGCDFRSKYITNVGRHESSRHQGVRYKCDRCDFTARQRVEVLSHSNSKHEGIVYNCQHCDFKTPWKSFFKKHNVDKHGASPSSKRESPQPFSMRRLKHNSSLTEEPIKGEGSPYSCPTCDFTSPNLQTINYHMRKRRPELLFSCDQCDHKNCLERSLGRHKMRTHGATPNLDCCPKCGYHSKNSAIMRYHLKNSNKIEEVFTCNLCDYKSCFERSLVKHKVKVHTVQREKKDTQSYTSCQNCGFYSKLSAVMRYHLKNSKPDEVFECNLCDYKSCFERSLKKHKVKTHKTDPENRCPHCDFTTTKSNLMNYHLKRSQSDGGLFRCDQCDYKNCSKKGLRFHQTRYHQPSQLLTANCAKCDFKSSNTKSLDAHIEESKDGEVHYCDLCDYKNCSDQGLEIHKARIHKKQNSKLECSKCGTKHQSITALKAHKSDCVGLELEETAESKPKLEEETLTEKSCEKCGFTTTDSDDFYDHVLEHLPVNTSEPQKFTSFNPKPKVSGSELDTSSSENSYRSVTINSSMNSVDINAFKDKLRKRMNQVFEASSVEERVDGEMLSLEPGEIDNNVEEKVDLEMPEVTLEPGEIVRDLEEKVDIEMPKDTLEPGEIVRVGDTEGGEVNNSELKSEPEPDPVCDNSMEPVTSAGDSEEVDAAVGFLMSLGHSSAEDVSPGDDQVKPEQPVVPGTVSPSPDGSSEIKCDFGCGWSFTSEENLYIHITDFHNEF